MKEFIVSEELKELAEEIIKTEKIDIGNANIGYLLVSPNISKTVAGKCKRTGPEFKYFVSFDYLIEISEDVWQALDNEQKRILVFHELMHVLVVINKAGDYMYKLKSHDVEDFSKLIKLYGTDWISVVKNTISSLHDLDPAAYDSIKI